MIPLRESLFILLMTAGILSGALATSRWLRGAEKLLAGAILFLSENILSVVLLGFLGFLKPWALATTLMGFIVGHTLFALRTRGMGPCSLAPKSRLKPGTKSGLNVFLWVIAGAWFGFLAVEAWVMPPRGWDSLSYHLTNPLYWLQEGKIALLPYSILKENAGFAYPANGETLYLLQLGITGAQRFLGFSPLIYIMLCFPALKLLSRDDGSIAFFLMFLSPLGLAQAITNYIDWGFCFWYLGATGFLWGYWKHGGRARLILALIALSALAGVKYTGLVFYIIFTLILIILGFKKRNALALITTIGLSLCLWLPWYIRNWIVLGNPAFDMCIKLGPWVIFQGKVSPYAYGYQYLATINQVIVFPFRDIGLGTYEGGSGPLFWLVGLPLALLFMLKDAVKMDWPSVFVWAQAPLFLCLFATIPGYIHPGELRLIMPLLAIGFLALARAWRLAGRPWMVSSVIILSVLFQSLGALQLGEHRVFPKALKDYLTGKRVSLMSYYSYQFPESVRWAELDGRGTTILAEDKFGLFAPLFGSRLQNKVEFR
ncbi:MAG: hypothetical protein ABIN66_02120 [candidate division WOR-3 bacterium]